MFLRSTRRKKDGKEHRYWSVVENRRVSGGGAVQRHVLYLGEINDSQQAAWSEAIEVFDEDDQTTKQVALFPEHRPAPVLDCDVIRIRIGEMRLCRPRQWGACWLSCYLWDLLRLDEFWNGRLEPSRKGTSWLHVLKTLVSYQLIDPGSEWRLHRQWYDRSAMGDLLGCDARLAQDNIDVHLPTTDGRQVILSRYTEPEKDHQLLLQRLKFELPAQPKPRITTDDLKKSA